MIGIAFAAPASEGTIKAAEGIGEPINPEIWVAVAFLLFIALVWWKGRASIVQTLDARAARIKAELDEARQLREQAAALLAEQQERQAQADRDAAAFGQRAAEEAERIGREAAFDAEQTVRRREKTALDAIAQAEAQARADVRQAAVHAAIEATRRLAVDELAGQRGQALVDQSIAELPRLA